ncbi:EF hand family protein [Tritrichomonas foetus]|uniref:EF hand family protein n=1 Tax=Tritrichomonas foetus TaxID=1144522 RepID=A0A1J4KC99_9EUKA|nr:EF hand family protein [Tritrichomonas foetus]|eukprot:OHT09049.1 EF hand family protein [Tritrichomonas foetus]
MLFFIIQKIFLLKMDGVESILQRIKDFTTSHAVDVENELLCYDVKRRGIISQTSLYRWLGTIGINLSSRNIHTLSIVYAKEDGIDVYKLIHDIENACSFNKTISARPPDCTKELLDLQRELLRRRQNVREVLAPFDRMNLGHVNPDNFYRAFGATPTTRTIVNCYLIGDKIDYLRLANDVYNANKSQQGNKVISVPAPTPSFTELATYIKSREIEPRKFFTQQDRLNTGKMTFRMFTSILSSFGASISPRGYEEIANSFLDDESSGFCNYNLFIKAIDEFVLPPPPHATSYLQTVAQEGAQYQKQQTPEVLLQAAKGTIADRRINTHLHFAGLQREGYAGDEIPLHKFIRIVSGMKIDLSYEEIESIASLFTSNGQIRYRDFLQAVEPQSTTRTVTLGDVIPRLRDHLYQTRQQLARVAMRFDRENSGNIASMQLSSILQFVRFDCTHQDIAALRDAFPGNERGTVCWRDLCAQVDQPIREYETNSKCAEDSLGLSVLTSRPPVESNPPPKHIADIVNKINSSFASTDELVAGFRSRDRLKNGLVNNEQFVNFLYNLPCGITPAELRAVVAYYRVSGSSNINYLQLANDSKLVRDGISETQRQATEPQLEATPTAIDPIPELTPEIHSFLKRLKSFASQRRFHPLNLFEPYDSLHNGNIVKYKVQSCFAQVDFPLNRNELEQIVEVFRDTKRPEYFNYNTFLRALDEEDITSAESRSSITAAPISSEVDREATTTCSQIREKLLARHRRIEMIFNGVNTPTISTREFQQRLGLIDIVIRASQTTSLIRKYRVNISDEVDWKRFCEDVNNSKTI